jgi:hypothetical protein
MRIIRQFFLQPRQSDLDSRAYITDTLEPISLAKVLEHSHIG